MMQETRKEIESDPGGSVRYWRMELEAAEKEEKEYRETARDLVKKYSGEKELDFNILWANVETLKPAVYSQTAQPDVRRRHNTQDPIGRQISTGLERAIKYACESYDFDENVRLSRDEMLITGRGVCRVEYSPLIVSRDVSSVRFDQESGRAVVDIERVEEIAEQHIYVKYVHFDDFRMSPAKCWEDVRWVAFRHTPTREELRRKFGEKGARVPLTQTVIDAEQARDKVLSEEVIRRGEIWEIWDKQERKRIWYASGFPNLLEEEEDPYGLEGFFPMPKPLYSFRVPGTMVPRAEYEVYRKQVEILNKTCRRINDLTEELKVCGLYSAVHDQAEKIIRARSGEFIPIEIVGQTAVKDMIAFWPVEEIARAMVSLYRARDDQIQIIYQLTGLSDIVRGTSKPTETATAQQLKGNFASLRMVPRQQPMNEFVRDIFKIKAEIIAEHFTPEILAEMTQTEFTPEMMQVLRSDRLRGYRVDVEADSTVQADQDADKQRRVEFLGAVTEFLSALAPMVQAGVLPVEVAKAMLSFGARGFKIGRELEEAIDQIGSQPAQRQQGDDPVKADMRKHQLDLQADMEKHRQSISADMQKKQMDIQARMAMAGMPAMGSA